MSEMQSSRPYGANLAHRGRGDSLADVLERVLDKGIVIAGDIRVELLDIELLTIRIRLLVASADKAAEMGITWWRNDPFLTDGDDRDTRGLRDRVDRLERQLAAPDAEAAPAGALSSESERQTP